MKTIFLIRHAKSDWKQEDLLDIDRPLNARGYKDATAMSRLLQEKSIQPDLIISSPAVRAISTALIFSRNLGYHPSGIIIRPELYESSVKHYLTILNTIDDTFNNVFLVGHNPVITDFANELAGNFTDNMPTCAIAGIRLSQNQKGWEQTKLKAENNLAAYYFPKNQL